MADEETPRMNAKGAEIGMHGPYNRDNIFAKILRGEIPCKEVYQDEKCLAFHDIAPQAPTHILVIPKKEISQLRHTTEEDEAILGHLLVAAGKIAAKEGLQDGYRIVINDGPAKCP